MGSETFFVGWLLDSRDRAALLAQIPPVYPEVIAHHVTLRIDARTGERAPPARQSTIVGLVDDRAGLQALVVCLNGTTRRPDAGVYHITWSLAAGRKAFEANAVIAAHGWRLFGSQPVRLIETVVQTSPASPPS